MDAAMADVVGQMQTEQLSEAEGAALTDVVWPRAEAERAAAQAVWFRQGVGELNFDGKVKHLWGDSQSLPAISIPIIPQRLNGPCGLLAVVQAEMTQRFLLMSKGSSPPTAQAMAQQALIDGISAMLLRAAAEAKGAEEDKFVVVAVGADLCDASVRVLRAKAADRSAVGQVVNVAIGALSAPPGAVLLLYSLVLTAGIAEVRQALKGEGKEGASPLGVPPAESLIVSSNVQEGGFCETALISLAAFGHAINSFSDGAWSALKKNSAPSVGVLTTEEFALGEDVVARWLRTPQSMAWVVLHGGHYTSLYRLDWTASSSNDGLVAAPDVNSSFAFVDNLGSTLTLGMLRLGDYEELPDSDAVFVAMRALEIVQSRAGSEYYVVCDPDGCLEGGVRPREKDRKWYCRDCYLSNPRVYAFNDAETEQCKECSKSETACGYGHWLMAAEVPPVLLSEYQRQHAPWQLRVLRTHWPRAAPAPAP